MDNKLMTSYNIQQYKKIIEIVQYVDYNDCRKSCDTASLNQPIRN